VTAEEIKFDITERQLEAVRLLAQGMTLGEIAGAMQIAPRTARSHLDEVRWKFQIRTRREIPRVLHDLGYAVYPESR
jgi:DNA-binding CsgD family transcriptional regulator